MALVFISYARKDLDITGHVVQDINAIGNKTWHDKELSGGQSWWTQILTSIRECDIFIFILSPHSLESEACKREYSYAHDLGKTIIPILVSDEVSTNLLPPALSQLQFVSYGNRSREEGLLLAKAFAQAPPSKPLPNPLPLEPEIPISYLSSLRQKIESSGALSYEEQSSLLLDLKRQMKEVNSRNDAASLLRIFLKRKDLYAAIGEEINELLGARSPSPGKQVATGEQNKKEITTFKVRKSTQNIDLKLFVMVIIGMIIGGGFSFFPLSDVVQFDLLYIQIFIAVAIGYFYRKSVAFISGLLLFLPNLILHVIGMTVVIDMGGASSPSWSFTGGYYMGKMSEMGLLWQNSRTLGVAYLFFGPLAFLVSFINGLITQESKSTSNEFDFKCERKINSVLLAPVLLLLLSHTLNLGAVQLSGVLAVLAIMYFQVYKYGVQQIRFLLVMFLLMQIVKLRFDGFGFLVSLSHVDFALFLLVLTILDRLAYDIDTRGKLIKCLVFLPIILLFLCSRYVVNVNVSLDLIALSIPLFYCFGYIGGSRVGGICSLTFCFCVFYTYMVSDKLALGNIGAFFDSYMIAIPLLGYLGGLSCTSSSPLVNGLKIVGSSFGVILLSHWLVYGPFGKYTEAIQLGSLISMAASLILLTFLLLLYRKSD